MKARFFEIPSVPRLTTRRCEPSNLKVLHGHDRALSNMNFWGRTEAFKSERSSSNLKVCTDTLLAFKVHFNGYFCFSTKVDAFKYVIIRNICSYVLYLHQVRFSIFIRKKVRGSGDTQRRHPSPSPTMASIGCDG